MILRGEQAVRSPFVGRVAELDELDALLEVHRLVTIAGVAGVGKTRLADRLAARIAGRFAEGAFFIDVSPLSDANLLAPEIAALLRPGVPVDGTDADSLALAIGERELLLVIDDCDHLADAVAKVLSTFLHRTSRMRILATSREALGAAGEAVYRLPPLGSQEAVTLFKERGGPSDSAALICRALAGVPLAIEIVASRKRPGATGELIEHPTAAATAAQSAIEWRYSHLSEEERRVLRTLAVFVGGFTFASAVDVCSLDEGGRERTRAILPELLDAALIQPLENGRFRLLEPVRAFARERLREADEAESAARRHAEAFDRLAREECDRLFEGPREAWIARMRPELSNFRAALTWALDKRNDSDLGGRIVGYLGVLWREIGLPVEGLRRAQQAAVQIDGDGRLWLTIAFIKSALWMLPREQLDAAERAENLFAAGGDRRGRIEALVRIGRAYAFMRKRDESKRAFESATQLAQEFGNRRLCTLVGYEAAIAAAQCDDFEGAKALYSSVYPQLREDDERRLASVALLNLAEVEFATGD
ncbi:MAG TPA: AAA family ATPase, partial [Verrucomicrobiae bacterium]|nr:AAA family ATPase [Verrucomicrobiae bacterium]